MKLQSTMLRSALSTLVLAGLGTSLFACKGELEGEEPPPVDKTAKKSNVIKIQTAVMPGKHLACSDMLPDVAVFSEALGVEVGAFKEKGRSNTSATAVCGVIRAGELPAAADEAKDLTLQEKYSRLGVLPGDSFCEITAYCSVSTTNDELETKCKADGNEVTLLAGEFACLRTTEKASEYSYTYKFIDPDTKCVVEALAGPSVNEQAVVRKCAEAARTAISKASVANAK